MKKIFGVLVALFGIVVVAPTYAIDGDFGFGVDGSVIATKDVNVGSTDELQRDAALLDIVKSAINRVLGLSALIALLFLLYGGFRMVTAAGGDGYDEGFKILKAAAIGITLIGVARFIVSIIFWLINVFATTAEGTEGWTSE